MPAGTPATFVAEPSSDPPSTTSAEPQATSEATLPAATATPATAGSVVGGEAEVADSRSVTLTVSREIEHGPSPGRPSPGRDPRNTSLRETSGVALVRPGLSDDTIVPMERQSVLKHAARHRLVRRDAPFHQSSGTFYMGRSGLRMPQLRKLMLSDWFHVVVSWPLWVLALATIVLYTAIIVIFAGFYMLIDGENSDCGLANYNETLDFHKAFAFSIETMTTIGYGIPHDTGAFFSRCYSLTFAVYAQALLFIFLNATYLGIMYARISNASTRAAQIIFSDKAAIRCVRGKFVLTLQVGEASFFRYHPVVEAHVRAYAVLHERKTGTGDDQALFQTRTVRLTSPNDELGGTLFLATPQLVSHRIDRWSPLYPPSAFTTPSRSPGLAPPTFAAPQGRGSDHALSWLRSRPILPGLVLREDDVDASEMIEAAVAERQAIWEAHPTLPHGGSASQVATPPSQAGAQLGLSSSRPEDRQPYQGFGADYESLESMREAIRRHLSESELELIVLVEAIDPFSSNTFQAVHSYMSSDIVFDSRFAPTMKVSENGQANLAWEAFHELRDAPFNSRQFVASSHS